VVLSAVSAGDRTATQLHSRHGRSRCGAPLCVSPVGGWRSGLFSSPRFRRFLVGADGPGTSSTNRSNDIARKHKKLFSENRTSPCVNQRWACFFRLLVMSTGWSWWGRWARPCPSAGEHPAGPTSGGVLSDGTGGRRRTVPAGTYRNRPAHRPPPPHSGESSRHHSFFPEPESPRWWEAFHLA